MQGLLLAHITLLDLGFGLGLFVSGALLGAWLVSYLHGATR